MNTTAKTILVVDDEQDIREALHDKFKSEGFHVLVADDGDVGLTIALEKHPDLIILDVIMPNMTGWEVLEQLRKDPWGANVPIIMLTVLDDVESASNAIKYKSYDILVKNDWKLSDVVDRVRERLSDDFLRTPI